MENRIIGAPKIKPSFKLICLERSDNHIQGFINDHHLYNHLINVDRQDLNFDELLASNHISVICILDSELSIHSVSLACESLRHGLETYVAVANGLDKNWLRAIRIFHAGGICLSLEDMGKELQSTYKEMAFTTN